MGFKMGDPYFKIEELCNRMRVIVYSSNYTLYGDLSRRIMDILSEAAPEIQVYSIDEAFLKYPGADPGGLESVCIELRKQLKRWVGIPVSFGIAPTKTLAKVANDLAKKNQGYRVCDLSSPARWKEVLEGYPVGEVWGVGMRLKERLHAMAIFTAGDFSKAEPALIRKKMGVVGERMLWELRGVSCLDLEEVEAKKSITCSRSFGQLLTEEADLAEALASHVATACVKLRRQRSCAQALSVFLEARSPDSKLFMRNHFGATVDFPIATNDTAAVITAAKRCLRKIFRAGERYKKCGIILLELLPEQNVVPDLFLGAVDPKRSLLMHRLDHINGHFGKNSVFFGAMGTNPRWKMRSDLLSHYNTTDLDNLPLVRA